VAHDGLQTAKRLDHISSMLFPAAFLLIIAAFLVL
jgi:hypothetical protein